MTGFVKKVTNFKEIHTIVTPLEYVIPFEKNMSKPHLLFHSDSHCF